MSDITLTQEYLYHGQRSCDLFKQFNIVLERDFLMDNELEFDAIWQNPRYAGGPVGAGYYHEMPRLDVPMPNSLQRQLVVSILAIEERNMNMTPGVGTLMTSEDMAELALDFMYGWLLGLTSALSPQHGTITPERKFQPLMAYRASMVCRREHHALPRCDMPVLAGGPAPAATTLTNGANTPAAQIYYTLNNSLPGSANKEAVLYVGPLLLPAGTGINWCAWQFDHLPSHIQTKQF